MKFLISVFVAFAACFYLCHAAFYVDKKSYDEKFEKPYAVALKSWFNLTVQQWEQKCSVEGQYVMTDVKNLVKLSVKIGRDLSDDLAIGYGATGSKFDIIVSENCNLNIVLVDLKVYGAERLQLCLDEKQRLSEDNTRKLAREIQIGFCAAVKEVALEKKKEN